MATACALQGLWIGGARWMRRAHRPVLEKDIQTAQTASDEVVGRIGSDGRPLKMHNGICTSQLA